MYQLPLINKNRLFIIKMATFALLETVVVIFDSMDNVTTCWQVQERKWSIVSTFTDAFLCTICITYNNNSD